MRTTPLPADFIYARTCKLKCEKFLTRPIKNQLQQDQIADQLSLKEFVDPFTGSKNTKA